MGGNPAENHPCGFKWAIEAKKTRNAKLVAVDPRFTRTAAVADLYSPIRAGTDIAYLLGIIRYAIENKRYHEEYVKLLTNAPYVIGEKYGFDDGLFSGFDEAARATTTRRAWALRGRPEDEGVRRRPDAPGPALRLPAPEEARRPLHAGDGREDLRHPEGNVPEGLPRSSRRRATPERVGTIMYALGWTQHSTGVQMIRAAAMLQLLLGNVGRPGRRRQRAPRPLEHPGRDRHGRARSRSCPATSRRRGPGAGRR